MIFLQRIHLQHNCLWNADSFVPIDIGYQHVNTVLEQVPKRGRPPNILNQYDIIKASTQQLLSEILSFWLNHIFQEQGKFSVAKQLLVSGDLTCVLFSTAVRSLPSMLIVQPFYSIPSMLPGALLMTLLRYHVTELNLHLEHATSVVFSMVRYM